MSSHLRKQPVKRPRQRRAKMGFAKGTIKEIDLLRHEIKLTSEDGPRTFTYTSRTYIFRDKEKITADNLKIGEVIAFALQHGQGRQRGRFTHQSPHPVRTHGAAATPLRPATGHEKSPDFLWRPASRKSRRSL